MKLPDGTDKDLDDACPFELEEFGCKVKSYAKDRAALKSTLRSLLIVILGQFSKMLNTKLQGYSMYRQVEQKGNVAELLKMIRAISREIIANESIYDAFDEAKRNHYMYEQAPHEDN